MLGIYSDEYINPECLALIFGSILMSNISNYSSLFHKIFTSKCNKAEVTQFCSMFLLMQHKLAQGFSRIFPLSKYIKLLFV